MCARSFCNVRICKQSYEFCYLKMWNYLAYAGVKIRSLCFIIVIFVDNIVS